MIPRIIHYCWFGRNPLPPLAEDCMASWRRHLPDYEIVEWNEDNFDINQIPYVKEAYEAKKYAFVSDYVRLYALYTVGGVYMDTDAELLRPLDDFLCHEVFSGFESRDKIPTAVMGAAPNHGTVKMLLDYYEGKHFLLPDGSYDTTTNVEIITDMMTPLGLQKNDGLQTVAGFTLYPHYVFCPILSKIDDEEYMNNTVAIHHFMASWKSPRRKAREANVFYKMGVVAYRVMRKIFGKPTERLKQFISKNFFKD